MVRSNTTIGLFVLAMVAAMLLSAPGRVPAADACKAPPGDVDGCQPSTFDPPVGQMPSTRVNAKGEIDHKSSDEDARRGVMRLEKKLGLFRNFTDVHWIPLLPSKTDPASGAKSGGDLDGEGDGRGLTIAGNCLFGGHWNAPRRSRSAGVAGPDQPPPSGESSASATRADGAIPDHPVDVFRIQADPVRNAPVFVGHIANPVPGYDDTMFDAALIKKADGTDEIVLMRDMDEAVGKGDGRMYVYAIDPATCQVETASTPYLFGGDFHEPSLWIDPNNQKRVLIVAASYIGGQPDPNRPGSVTPDLYVFAITNEDTGEILPKPAILATFRLQDVGGPIAGERPDSTGLFSDGRFVDWSNVKNQRGEPVSTTKRENNGIHQATMSIDGERIYVAGTTAGFFILSTQAIAHHRNTDLASGAAGCNQNSTNVYRDGVIGNGIDPALLAHLPNDCIHMVVNDDPGVRALVSAGKVGAYLTLQDRSRWDPFPPRPVHTGIHSAIAVPNRPSLAKNSGGQERPALVLLTEERFDCPFGSIVLVQVDSEITPQVIGTYGLLTNNMGPCLQIPATEPNGDKRLHSYSPFSHDPTVFKNLVFSTWINGGLRAVDIANERNPREVGYAVTLPSSGGARSYPVYKDGLFYWMDLATGIHVVKYTGPRADELPAAGSGMVYEGNSVPHR